VKLWRVDDVMTRDVATVFGDAPFHEIVDVLATRRVSAVPVVDRFGLVVGVVSEADLLHKVEQVGAPPPRGLDRFRRRASLAKAAGRTASDVMTSPAVTVGPSLAVSAAARRMESAHVRRMPVVDQSGHLIGVVSRGDLLKMHQRSDAEIRRDVTDEVFKAVLGEGDVARAQVRAGVVTLVGTLQRRSAVEAAVLLSRQVPGVVDVVDMLGYGYDDTVGRRAALPYGVA
jgi:CBS domain-containing protein